MGINYGDVHGCVNKAAMKSHKHARGVRVRHLHAHAAHRATYPSRMFTSAPAATSNFATAKSPLRAAKCRGESPSLWRKWVRGGCGIKMQSVTGAASLTHACARCSSCISPVLHVHVCSCGHEQPCYFMTAESSHMQGRATASV